MKLPTIHQMPFLRFLLPMMVGILLYNYDQSLWLVGASITFAIFGFIIFQITKKGKQAYQLRYLFGVSLSLLFVSVGFLSTFYHTRESSYEFATGKHFYSAEIKSVPDEKERSIYCQLKVTNQDSIQNFSQNKKIIAYFHKEEVSLNLKQGDRLIIYIEPQPLINANRPGGFDFATYMQRQGFSATAYVDSASWKKMNLARSFNLQYLATDLREKILVLFRSFHFNENEFALLSGITIGYQDALSMEQKTNFSAVGLSHLMAVSGMQTAMIFAMVWFLMGFIPKNSRFYRLKYLVVILVLWIFTFVTGLSASVVRASIMLTVLMAGGLFGKKTITMNSLVFAAFCLLLINPYSLYDIGFQLSFLAVLSILMAQDILKNRFDHLPKISRYFAELSTMTLAAQLGTSPLSIFYFHQFPLLFLIVNLIILPFNGILVYLACLCTFLASVHIPHLWFDKILQFMLHSLDYTTASFAKVPFSQIKNLNPNSTEIVLFYLFLGAMLLFIYQKKFRFVIYGIGIILCIESSMIYQKWGERNISQLMIYNQFGKNVVEFQKNGKNLLLGSESNLFIWEGKRIARLDQDIRFITSEKRLNCHYLILTKGFKGNLDRLNALYQYSEIIIDVSLSKYYRNNLVKELRAEGIGYFDMNEKGAFLASK
ncbi:MAG: ComEC/Rec2 family competence protein [Candidatus Pacebacteria bacterium]|nr:ComEC/Rec2 family competence protein [Candidatus Paceibacterota bacterium]